MTAAYSIESLTFRYGSRTCLEVNDLEISQGDVVALVGPNGAGKTTLLHLLAFVERPASGGIRFFGESVARHNLLACRRRVGLLLQNPYLFHTSVMSNIVWGLKIRGMRGEESRRAALEALERVGLSGFEHRQARTLSGGESQRAALARSLALDPDVLLLDEPANHLDRQSVQRTREIVLHLNRSLGKTVILATHNLAEVKGMARSLVHIFQGRVVPGSPENLFHGRLSDCGSRFDTGRIIVQLSANARAGTHVTVDPARIVLTRFRPEAEAPNVFRGRVISLSADDGFVTILVEAGERFQIQTAWGSEQASDLCLGQGVWLTLKSDGISVF